MVKSLKRLSSGIPGLDDVLCGGFVEGASYILQGRPGAGKTIMANQIAFAQLEQGQRVLYVTLLAESHERLFQALSTLEFYDAGKVGVDITFVSAFQTLRSEGLDAVVSLLRREMARKNPSMLIIDGLISARDKAEEPLDVKTFVAELNAHAAFSHCTVMLLTSATPGVSSPEHTMVDGVLELHEKMKGSRTARQLQVTKSRGSNALRGSHCYEITSNGVAVFPRIETFFERPAIEGELSATLLGSGMPTFDALVQGGFPASSVTLLMGPSGSGKTTFGLSYLSLATPAQPAIMFNFYESPKRLARKARSIGIDLDQLVQSGALKILWYPLADNLLDKLAYDLLDAIRSIGAHRVFIDGLGGFERASIDDERLVGFFATLADELRLAGATTIATWESRNLFGLQTNSPMPEISSLADNLLLLRHVERADGLKRVLAVLKLRDGAFDAGLHLVSITDQGLHVDGPFLSNEFAHGSNAPASAPSSD